MKSPEIAEPLRHGMSQEECQHSIETLSEVLCNQHVLYIKTRNYHWNLKGPRFHDLHQFFEELYKKLEVAIDDTAERIRMLGGISPGSMSEFLAGATLEEAGREIVPGDQAIASLIQDHDAVIRDLRVEIPKCESEYNDVGTADFLIALLRAHEEVAWMLRSFTEM